MIPPDLPATQILAFARRAERLGFAQIWVVEDLGFRGGFAQAGAVLAATEHITVGIGILPAGARNAAFAAMEIATLGQLFPGRVIAGLGHGMPDWMRQAGAWPASPLTLLEEYTVALRTLLTGAPGPAAGRYVNVEDVVLTEVPEVAVPLVLGVRGPKSLALAGRVSDGVLLAEPSPPTYITSSVAHAAATQPADFQVITYDVAAVNDSPIFAIASVQDRLGNFGEPSWAPHLEGLPFTEELRALRATSATPQEFSAALDPQWVAELTLAGSARQVRAGIAARHRAGATMVVLTPVGEDRLGQLEQLARVLP